MREYRMDVDALLEYILMMTRGQSHLISNSYIDEADFQ